MTGEPTAETVPDRDDARPGFSGSRARRAARTLGGVVDQGVWSLSNISLVVVAAKRSGLEDVGVMGVVVLLYVLALGMVRAATGLSLIIRFSAVDVATRRRATGGAVSSAALLGLGGTALFVIVGLVAGGRMRGPMLAVGTLFPLLMVQDVVRYNWLAERRAWRAALTDTVWLAAAVIGYPIAITQGFGTTGMAFAWAAGGAISALVDLAALRLPLSRPGDALHFARTHWDLTGHQLLEAVLQYGSSVFGVAFLGFVASLDAVGQVRLGQSLLGPLRTLLLGVAMAEVPEAVHAAHMGAVALRRRITSVSIALGTLVAGAGVVLQLIPDSIGSIPLGDNWGAAQEIALPLMFGFIGLAVSFGPMVGLRSGQHARVIVRCALVQVVLSTAGFVIGAAVADSMGAATGQSVGLLLATVCWWRTWLRSVHDRASEPEDAEQAEEVVVEELRTLAGD